MQHTTSPVFDDRVLGVIVLTGPPASGKTTARYLLGDVGAVGFDVGTIPRDDLFMEEETAEFPHEPTWQRKCRVLVRESSPGDLLVVEGIQDDEEVEWLKGLVDRVLVVSVDTRSQHERALRYVERESNTNGMDGIVEEEYLARLETKFYEREAMERPYPSHAVTVLNDDSKSITELYHQLGDLAVALGRAPIVD